MSFYNTWKTSGLGAAINPAKYRVSGAEADPASPVYGDQRKRGAALAVEDRLNRIGTVVADPYAMIQSLQGTVTVQPQARTDGTGSAQDVAGRAYLKGYVAEVFKDERRNEALQMVVDALMLPKKNRGHIPMSQQARDETIATLQQMMEENRLLKRDQPLEDRFQDKNNPMHWGSRGFNARLNSWHRPHTHSAWW